MRGLAKPLGLIVALAVAAVVAALLLGRSASVGLYVGGAILLVVAALSRGTMVIGAYGEYSGPESIRQSNAIRGAYLLVGLVMIGLGVLVETLGQ